LILNIISTSFLAKSYCENIAIRVVKAFTWK